MTAESSSLFPTRVGLVRAKTARPHLADITTNPSPCCQGNHNLATATWQRPTPQGIDWVSNVVRGGLGGVLLSLSMQRDTQGLSFARHWEDGGLTKTMMTPWPELGLTQRWKMALIYSLLINLPVRCSSDLKNIVVIFGLRRLRFIPCIIYLLKLTKLHYSTEIDMVTFSLKFLFKAQPNGCHSKYRCKGSFLAAKCTFNHQVKWTKLRWQNDVSNKQPLPSP